MIGNTKFDALDRLSRLKHHVSRHKTIPTKSKVVEYGPDTCIMESPPTISTHSEAPLISEDSGLLITSGSFSSDSASGWHHIASELQESDYEEKSLSLCESTEASDHICSNNFNTVKKGPSKIFITTIAPPPEFQDHPSVTSNAALSKEQPKNENTIYNRHTFVLEIPLSDIHISPKCTQKLKPESSCERRQYLDFASPRILHLSPSRTRPSSRNSLSSRLSSSHNSLVSQFQSDDTNFITQAISHDTLPSTHSDIPDLYNVPFDSDIYAVPVDSIKPMYNFRHKGKKPPKRKKRKCTSQYKPLNIPETSSRHHKELPSSFRYKEVKGKHDSLPSTSINKTVRQPDTLQRTLWDMRKYLHTLHSSSSESDEMNAINGHNKESVVKTIVKDKHCKTISSVDAVRNENNNNYSKKLNKNCETNAKSKKKDGTVCKEVVEVERKEAAKAQSKPFNLKQSFCNLFRWRRQTSVEVETNVTEDVKMPAAVQRALPPLPQTPQSSKRHVTDFATSIQRVKDYGWYWGPISSETAEKVLSNEPDGSFIVRDSSDDHYIFTLTFKLNGLRHVRIEHDQGNFCFSGCAMFKATTIVEFIENAVETSRSGRYLFFLNLRPILGPVRVQLLYPVSRFKRIQSLQHMSRFAIMKRVRRDLVEQLPLPRRLLDYLSAAYYYCERLPDT